MNSANIIITNQELEILKNKEFFDSKIRINQAVQELFLLLRDAIKYSEATQRIQEFYAPEISSKIDFITGKISKGENYRNYPYMVLDFPKYYGKDFIFAYRTMLWWGHSFSFTLHLQGEVFNAFKKKIFSRMLQAAYEDFFLCVNKGPWEYHYGKDNYLAIGELKNKLSILEDAEKFEFLKISATLSLDRFAEIPEKGRVVWEKFAGLLL